MHLTPLLTPLMPLLVFDHGFGMAFEMSPKLIHQNEQIQESRITVNVEEIDAPQLLRVRTSSSLSYLSGSIILNGRIIKHLSNGTTNIDIAPYLMTGENTINIMGRYAPSSTVLEIVLQGPNSRIYHHLSNNGDINSLIIVDVR